MAYIICEVHGGNVAAMVSPEVAKWINSNSVDFENLKKITSIDESGKNYRNFVDVNFYKYIQDRFGIDLEKPITSEELMFEIDLELVPVCSFCLNERILVF